MLEPKLSTIALPRQRRHCSIVSPRVLEPKLSSIVLPDILSKHSSIDLLKVTEPTLSSIVLSRVLQPKLSTIVLPDSQKTESFSLTQSVRDDAEYCPDSQSRH